MLLMPGAASGRKVLSVTQFGAVPNDGLDDGPALRKAAEWCRTHSGVELTWPAGVYDLRDSLAERIEREAISGAMGRGIEVQRKLFTEKGSPFYAVGLDFQGAKHLHIKAQGAVLRAWGWMEALSFRKAKDVTLEGLTLTTHRPAATEARVMEVGTDGYVTLQFDPERYTYVDESVQGRYYFYSERRGTFYYSGLKEPRLIAPGQIRSRVSGAQPEVGDVCVIRYGGHYRPCIMLKESSRVRLQDVTIMNHSGMGVVGHMSENILIDGLRVVPEPGCVSSTTTDATHFTSCSGEITIRNSVFRGNGDDCTNIHNYYYQAIGVGGHPKQVELSVVGADLHAQSLDVPQPGDTLWAVDAQSLAEQERYVVKSVTADEAAWRVRVTLDRPLRLLQGALMVNHSRFPHVRIENNTVVYHNGRAFLLKAPHVVVRGNKIMGSTLTAIKLGAELSWREAGPVESAWVENNYIMNCGSAGGKDSPTAVMVTTEARGDVPRVNRNIVIRNNFIDCGDRPAFLINDAQHVRIEGNIARGSGGGLRQHNTKDVTTDIK
ncbi:MAG: right-handed parallel beta-helix repeat-containing protein [Bacteroidaceae bacterium]|nr:right-handed parallel beta-helix repeat-containing protein [Bacteroidaceae bacterium]